MTAGQVKAAVNMQTVLTALNVKHDAKRADCPFCAGRSRRTVSITDTLYYCHRCGARGDVYSIVERVNRCDFPAALRFVAATGGLPMPASASGETVRAQIEERKRKRERLERAAVALEEQERELRIAHRGAWRELERLAHRSAMLNTDGRHDALLAALPALIRRDAASYMLLAFASARARAKYVLRPDCRRRAADAVLAGLVRDDDGRVLEVSA